MKAARGGYAQIAATLIRGGSKVQTLNGKGFAALHLASGTKCVGSSDSCAATARALLNATLQRLSGSNACAWDCIHRAIMLEPLAANVLKNGVKGDFLEAGVASGGVSEAKISAYTHTCRTEQFHAARSFLTTPRASVTPAWSATAPTPR